jgi:hypothetical protein
VGITMPTSNAAPIDISPELLEAIAAMPLSREVVHCGTPFRVSPFDIYAVCPACRTRIKVRSYSASLELEDLFDAVFAWMSQPGAAGLVRERQEMIRSDGE